MTLPPRSGVRAGHASPPQQPRQNAPQQRGGGRRDTPQFRQPRTWAGVSGVRFRARGFRPGILDAGIGGIASGGARFAQPGPRLQPGWAPRQPCVKTTDRALGDGSEHGRLCAGGFSHRGDQGKELATGSRARPRVTKTKRDRRSPSRQSSSSTRGWGTCWTNGRRPAHGTPRSRCGP
jgi:hypothetical protein